MEDSMIDIGSPLLNHLGKGGLLSPWNSLPEATLYSYYRRRCQASPKLCNVAQTDLRGYFMMSRFLFFGEMKAIKWNTWNTFEHFIFIIPSVHMKRWHESKGHKKSLTCLILSTLCTCRRTFHSYAVMLATITTPSSSNTHLESPV